MKKKTIILLPLIVVAIVCAVVFRKSDIGMTYHKSSGLVFGTSYNITYQSYEDYSNEIKAVLDSVDNSLSPFNEKSIITAVNENRDVQVDDDFIRVFTLARQVHDATDGAFDITVAPLVNAWGFGFRKGDFPTPAEIDSMRTIVGMDKVKLAGRKIVKADPRIMLDCSAIAKGYAVDKIALMLKRKGVENFLVEVGGEIVAAGTNPKGKEWSIGVTKPVDDSLSVNSDLQMILTMTDCALATSGNYRNYYVKDGHKYAHTINPKTGNPAESNSLSATIVAPSCAEADAYATACMVVGKDKALQILNRQADKKYIIIYDNNGKTEWVVIDSDTKAIQKLESVYPEDLVFCEEAGDTEEFERIRDFKDGEPFGEYKVRCIDIDYGLHMNNVAYVRAIEGLFTSKEWDEADFTDFQIDYKKSCFEGDTLYFTRKQENGATYLRGALADGTTIVLCKLSR